MRAAAAAGIASTVHAIGDAAVRRALDLMAPLPRVAIPHRIEHFQCVSRGRPRPGRRRRTRRLDAARASVDRHPARGASLGRPGPRRVRVSRPCGGATRRWSSAATCRWRRSIRARASSRRSSGGATPARPAGGWRPEEKLSFEEAVRAYTAGAAHAAGGRSRSGTLAPGQDADLVAWAFDPAVERGDGDAARAGSARLTVVGGEVVMRR